ncbi:MAG: hypothetical protein SXV54_28325 [Chloroflexota bacterium]|nr:hypothetical protein [Chloroflexota bacterium]
MVYTNEGSLWVIDGIEGSLSPQRLTSEVCDMDPLLSPDGHWVLFWRDSQSPLGTSCYTRRELWAIEVDGSGERRLVRPEDLLRRADTTTGSGTEIGLDRHPVQITWLRDSRTIAFNTGTSFDLPATAHYNDLWTIDVETGTLTQLLPDGEGGNFAFSPDGARLVISTPTKVMMMDADGKNRRTLITFDLVCTHSEYSYHPSAVWAPDGSYALVAISSQEPFDPDASGNLWRLPLIGDAVHLATLRGEFLHITREDGLWSPDRTHVAYTRQPLDGNDYERELVVADGDGGNPVVYAVGELCFQYCGFNPRFQGWSPDSHRFIFWQDDSFYVGQLDQPPVTLAPQEETHGVDCFGWIDEETFVYVTGEWEARSIQVGQTGGSHHTIVGALKGNLHLVVRRTKP